MTRIFVLAGQSNMVGAGVTAELPEAWRREPANVRVFADGDFREWAGGDRFGPEIGFGVALGEALPDTQIVLCKVAKGGANLYYDWNPDGAARGEEDIYRGPMYPLMLAEIDSLSARLQGQGTAALVSGMLWMQGERDSVFEFMAEAYEANLRAFIRQVRADLAAPAMPFLVALICPRIIELPDLGYRHACRDTVRRAQAAVAESGTAVSLIPTDDLPQGDNLHFTTAGLLKLGRRYAKAYLGAAGGRGD